jgi:hypothetical protein
MGECDPAALSNLLKAILRRRYPAQSDPRGARLSGRLT